MPIGRPIWKTVENTTPFYLHPKMGKKVPKTGIIFISKVVTTGWFLTELHCNGRYNRQYMTRVVIVG